MRNRINEYKKRVNPKIVKDISNLFKPYWNLINQSSDYYKLQSLGIDIGKINIKVKKDVERLLLAFQKAAWIKIDEKIEKIHGNDRIKEYSITHIRKFLAKHKIDNVYYSVLFNAIYGKMMVNLGLEDFKMISKDGKKARFYSLDIGNMQSSEIDKRTVLDLTAHMIHQKDSNLDLRYNF